VNGVIEITAPNQITLLAGDSGIEMNGANVALKTPGTVSWKAASKNAGGALSGGTSLPTLPVGVVGVLGLEKASFAPLPVESTPSLRTSFDEQVRAVSKSNGEPIANLPFSAETASGRKYSGVTNEEGKIPRIHTATAESIKVSFANSDAPQIEPQFGDAGGC
jgi:type VI secretion system secreted protein VgrG